MKPIKNSHCAVIIPTHKSDFSAIEMYCIKKSISVLSGWDIIFLVPEDLDLGVIYDFPVKILRVDNSNFGRIERVNRFLLSSLVYEQFLYYDRILICHPDAIVARDELNYWIDKPIDYIGAPWFDSMRFTPNFISRTELNGPTHILNVGNGGLSLRNPRKFLRMIEKHSTIISEFCLNSGALCNEDGMISYLGLIDPEFRIATHDDAVKFALELNAREQIVNSGYSPMGFHAMYKFDPELWMHIFPDSPSVVATK